MPESCTPGLLSHHFSVIFARRIFDPAVTSLFQHFQPQSIAHFNPSLSHISNLVHLPTSLLTGYLVHKIESLKHKTNTIRLIKVELAAGNNSILARILKHLKHMQFTYARRIYTIKTKAKKIKTKKHTTAGIRWWSPTQLLICRFTAWVQESGRDPLFSVICGRMYQGGWTLWLYTCPADF